MLSTQQPKATRPQAPASATWADRGRRVLDIVLLRTRFPSRRIAAQRMFWLLLGLSGLLGILCGLALVFSVDMPQMEELAKYRPSTTTELLDVHGNMIGSFALERRVVVPYSDFPVVLRQAIVSIEDKSFEGNWGINLVRAAGAAYADVHSKGRAQGASTLTMQLARNLFLSAQKTYTRKLQEIFLTVQIERRFSKDQIFSLYANQIYLGHGRYGFEAGSQFYFSKHVRDLILPEAALLAALPKGPEYYSPIRFPERALRRRNLVLSEMYSDGRITQEQMLQAKAAPLGLRIESPPNSIAPYYIEEVRRQLEKEYGVDEVHGAGLRVYTTLDLDLQRAANKAVLDGTARYERRRGWQGRLQNVADAHLDMATYVHPDWTQPVADGDYVHGMVVEANSKRLLVKVGRKTALLEPASVVWTGKGTPASFLKTGDLIYVKILSGADGPQPLAALEQDSGAQASMMAVNNENGEVLALVGGRDFALSQYNRATQSQRQVGSSFKPYDYVAAFEAGMKPSDIVMDEPTSFPSPGGWYTPHDYEAGYAGAMTLTQAFEQSRNIPALKLAYKVGIRNVIAVAHRFGITSELPAFLPVAIGAADITLSEQVGAYSVFPNDGIRIEPHYIRRVTQADGVPLDAKTPQVTEVISVETARQMMGLLQAVVQHGTAAVASTLNHPLGGKTGTTNDFTDAWFVGFSPSVTCGTWIGFDNPHQTLGKGEQGAKVALPMWMDFMKVAIAGKDGEHFPAAGAPKRTLAMPVTSSPVQPEAQPEKPDDDDPSADPADPDATPKHPAPIVRSAPSDSPVVPLTPSPIAPPPQN